MGLRIVDNPVVKLEPALTRATAHLPMSDAHRQALEAVHVAEEVVAECRAVDQIDATLALIDEARNANREMERAVEWAKLEEA